MSATTHVVCLMPELRPSRIASPSSASANRDAAKWQLYELDERDETCVPLDRGYSGNPPRRAPQLHGDRSDEFFLFCPERWLESLLTRDVRAID